MQNSFPNPPELTHRSLAFSRSVQSVRWLIGGVGTFGRILSSNTSCQLFLARREEIVTKWLEYCHSIEWEASAVRPVAFRRKVAVAKNLTQIRRLTRMSWIGSIATENPFERDLHGRFSSAASPRGEPLRSG